MSTPDAQLAANMAAAAEAADAGNVLDYAYVCFEPTAYDLGITDDPEPEAEPW